MPRESTIMSILEENKILLQELDASREQLEYLQKQYEEFVMKSKADVDLFVKEIKFLRGTQSDLKQECSQMMKEKSELEVDFFLSPCRLKAILSEKLFKLGCGIMENREDHMWIMLTENITDIFQ